MVGVVVVVGPVVDCLVPSVGMVAVVADGGVVVVEVRHNYDELGQFQYFVSRGSYLVCVVVECAVMGMVGDSLMRHGSSCCCCWR